MTEVFELDSHSITPSATSSISQDNCRAEFPAELLLELSVEIGRVAQWPRFARCGDSDALAQDALLAAWLFFGRRPYALASLNVRAAAVTHVSWVFGHWWQKEKRRRRIGKDAFLIDRIVFSSALRAAQFAR